ncbi:cell surface protein [Metarhizium album ARSEF 1941]|uniref:Cell surface protein n=1 Tax=Metarhizium album (strain ARSEF 1941) TaxID=1081103 RepID=A0A0B2WZM4_METAS|nr:cell surface protein [Metarhizium album ARSEF 1941]KHN98265.1 cell surface protein [Metarhizium album ARSEF 1941]
MHFIKASATLAVAVASLAKAAAPIPPQAVNELQAYATIFNDPNVNKTEYGVPMEVQARQHAESCNKQCGLVIQLIAKEGCGSGWEEHWASCETCIFHKVHDGTEFNTTWAPGLKKALGICGRDPQLDRHPDYEKNDCHYACGILSSYRRGDDCPDDWQIWERSCKSCFASERLGPLMEENYRHGVNLALKKCRGHRGAAPGVNAATSEADVATQSKSTDGQVDWSAVGISMGLSKDQTACHAACGKTPIICWLGRLTPVQGEGRGLT